MLSLIIARKWNVNQSLIELGKMWVNYTEPIRSILNWISLAGVIILTGIFVWCLWVVFVYDRSCKK